MKVYRKILSKSLTKTPKRTFAGGGAVKKMPKDTTDFDICIIGGMNATALAKFIQNDGTGLKMALITDKSKFVRPDLYFFCSYAAIKELQLESASVGAQIDGSARVNATTRAAKIDPEKNTVQLENGTEYTYKALIYNPGFNHTTDNIEGLREIDELGEQYNVFAHIPDTVERIDRNYNHGFLPYGDNYIVYNPAFPYKDEGSSFYLFYYEFLLRQDIMFQRSPATTKLQYWTPNKEFFKFSYANEIILDQCEKRGIEVNFGWELTEMYLDEVGKKIGKFKNVDTGKEIETGF